MRRTLNITASFLAGAAAVVALDRALQRWRAAHAADHRLGVRERVQARIRELASFPEAIRVHFDGRLLRVSGHVLAGEMDRLLSELTQVRGVHRVHNALSPVQDAARLEALARGRAGERSTADAPERQLAD